MSHLTPIEILLAKIIDTQPLLLSQFVVAVIGLALNFWALCTARTDLRLIRERNQREGIKIGPRQIVAESHLRLELISVAVQFILVATTLSLIIWPSPLSFVDDLVKTRVVFGRLGMMGINVLIVARGFIAHRDRHVIMRAKIVPV